MSKKEIVFPHFLHCCQETTDLYWKYIFEDLSYARAPYGVYFTKGFMCCGFRGKEFSYRVDPNKPVPELYREVKHILQSKLDIQSADDRLNKREKFDNSTLNHALNECNDWNDVKRKEVRCLLLEKFILRESDTVPKATLKKAYATLMLAIQLKIIVNDDITLENGNVISIENWDTINGDTLSGWDFDTKKKPESNNNKRKVSSLWKK